VLAFRLFVPDTVYPVSYQRGKTAHLDITGPRRQAILTALRDQLGLETTTLEPFGLEGSGGSTPLRIELDTGRYIFAKVYAQNHLRSDRWYKLGRSLLYGALEDEAPYRTVRRLAEHEDHMMRLMVAAGVPTPEPLGVVDITPGREYLLVTDFVEDAREVSQAEVNEAIVRAGLEAVRAMWDAGLAHRDLKPANILVRGDAVFLIDHAFGEIRPTPWRQAADLANMMLTMSVRFPAADVHTLAGELFTPDEVGEAFAVARGVTIPGELRSAMRETGRDVLAENRSLAPGRPPMGIQRWTPRRIWALLVVAGLAVFVGRLLLLNREIAGQLL
jgi:tRNA A-37 threonylcarbamoyl transferase component Bud32